MPLQNPIYGTVGPLINPRTHAPDYQIWSDFLRRYLDTSNPDGIHRVDYAGVTAEDQEGLNQYLLRLQKIPVSCLSRIQQWPSGSTSKMLSPFI